MSDQKRRSTNLTGAGLRPLTAGEFRQNPDGSRSTEVSVTVPAGNNKWMNIPSLWADEQGNLVELDEDGAAEAARLFSRRTGQRFPVFDTIESAVETAKRRSSAGGASSGKLAR